jgi:hypothetical protein
MWHDGREFDDRTRFLKLRVARAPLGAVLELVRDCPKARAEPAVGGIVARAWMPGHRFDQLGALKGRR